DVCALVRGLDREYLAKDFSGFPGPSALQCNRGDADVRVDIARIGLQRRLEQFARRGAVAAAEQVSGAHHLELDVLRALPHELEDRLLCGGGILPGHFGQYQQLAAHTAPGAFRNRLQQRDRLAAPAAEQIRTGQVEL